MKNKISTLFVALAFASSAQAQWTTDDKAFTIVGQDSIYGQCVLKTVRTNDGKTVLTWLNTPKNLNYNDPNFGYYLYMQTFDANGKPMLGKNGKLISQKPTMSYVTNYGLQLTANGNVVISYSDSRNIPDHSSVDNFLYCYTPEGEPVWDKDGIKIQSATSRPNYHDMVPTLCVSGNSLYGMIDHVEDFKIKADSTNWQPNPWIEDDVMPDSIDAQYSEYQIMRYADDGSRAWTSPVSVPSTDVWTYAAPDDGLYILYVNKGYGLDARRIDKDGKDVWAEPVNVESGAITSGSFTDAPAVVADGKGGLMLAYRKLLSYSGYIVANHLAADGTVYDDEFIINGTQDGDGAGPMIAVGGNKMFAAFSLTDVSDKQNVWVNQIDIDGDYTWEGDSLLGYSYAKNDMWGFKVVKTIAQNDGWVMLYGDAQSWNGANFYAVKIGFDGKTMWKKQIAEDDFKSSGFAIVNDDNNAYIFYTCDKEIDDDWQEIPGDGGMRVMCVDITGKSTGINHVNTANTATKTIYTAGGVKVGSMNRHGIYIVNEGGVQRKVVK